MAGVMVCSLFSSGASAMRKAEFFTLKLAMGPSYRNRDFSGGFGLAAP